MSTAWRHQPERGSPRLIRLLVFITLWVGRPVARGLLYPICSYFLLFSGGAQRTSPDYFSGNLNRPPSWEDVFRHFHAFASTIHDRVYLLSGRHRYFDIRTEGASALQAVLDQNRGCILLGSHLGSFEVLRAQGTFDHKLPISVIMHEAAASNLNAVLHNLHPEIRDRIIPPGTADTMLAVRERLSRGEIVGILGDRLFNDEKGMACEFLGKTRMFPEGPFLLAALLQVPIVLFFGLYQGGRRYNLYFRRRPRQSRTRCPHRARHHDRIGNRCSHACPGTIRIQPGRIGDAANSDARRGDRVRPGGPRNPRRRLTRVLAGLQGTLQVLSGHNAGMTPRDLRRRSSMNATSHQLPVLPATHRRFITDIYIPFSQSDGATDAEPDQSVSYIGQAQPFKLFDDHSREQFAWFTRLWTDASKTVETGAEMA